MHFYITGVRESTQFLLMSAWPRVRFVPAILVLISDDFHLRLPFFSFLLSLVYFPLFPFDARLAVHSGLVCPRFHQLQP